MYLELGVHFEKFIILFICFKSELISETLNMVGEIRCKWVLLGEKKKFIETSGRTQDGDVKAENTVLPDMTILMCLWH